MLKPTVKVVAFFKARPEKIDALRQVLSSFIEPTRKEKGCLLYELHQNSSDPTDFAFIEEWESHETLDRHLTTPHIQSALPHLGELIIGKPDIRQYEVSAL